MATESVTTFSALLRLPTGHTAAPVLDSPSAARLPACTRLTVAVAAYPLAGCREGLTCTLADWLPGRCPCTSGSFMSTFWSHVQCQNERVTSL